jgi:hypothetical protein
MSKMKNLKSYSEQLSPVLKMAAVGLGLYFFRKQLSGILAVLMASYVGSHLKEKDIRKLIPATVNGISSRIDFLKQKFFHHN